MSASQQALFMVSAGAPSGDTLIYLGAPSSQVGTRTAPNEGTLGGTFNGRVSNSIVDIDNAFKSTFLFGGVVDWDLTGGASGAVLSGVAETMEAWMLFTSAIGSFSEGGTLIFTPLVSGTNFQFDFLTEGFDAETRLSIKTGTGGTHYTARLPAYNNTWVHIALSKAAGSSLWTMFVNGASVGTFTRAVTHQIDSVKIFRQGAGTANIKVQNIRYRTNFAYTGTFTPPTRA